MLFLLIPTGLTAAAGLLLGRKIAKIGSNLGSKGTLSKQFNKPLTVEIAREYILSDETLVLATEEVPLDNRFGSHVLTSEHEFVRSASVALDIDRSREIGSSVRSGIWKAFEARASGELSKSLGVKIGSNITRRVRLKFSVAPQRAVNYRIIWKQESRRGEFELVIGGRKRYKVPYMVTYGLCHSVESVADATYRELSDSTVVAGSDSTNITEGGESVHEE